MASISPILLSSTLLVAPCITINAGEHKFMLAKQYQSQLSYQGYWLSEKFDGIRLMFDGQKFLTRQGNIVQAPAWFVAKMPKNVTLDGELWIGRNQFEKTLSLLSDVNNDQLWQQATFLVFDLPNLLLPFERRYTQLLDLQKQHSNGHFSVVEQFPYESEQQMQLKLQEVVNIGGEGLMLRQKNSYYQTGRSNDLIKIKIDQDDEAMVLAYVPGKGKYHGLMGALLVKNNEGKVFKIGTGFSDEQRKTPPLIGSQITYKYNGYTHLGTPRFARYWRPAQLN